jgi:hypothetical protein
LSSLQFNPQIHEQWGQSRLIFWRLAFSPTYSRTKALDELRHIFAEELGVTAYTVYELTGNFDLLVRVWLPRECTRAMLRERFRTLSEIGEVDYFEVDDTLRQWIWDDGVGGLRKPDPAVLRDGPGASDFYAVNRALATKTPLQEAQREAYIKANVLAETPTNPGVKFAVAVRAQNLGDRQRDAIRKTLLQIMNDAETIHERSLYEGEGFGQFLLIGRVAFEHFHAISAELTERINNDALLEGFGARTYTFPVATPHFVEFSDHLPINGTEPARESLRSYLEAGESESLEVKGSAFVDLKRYFIGDGARETPDEIADEGVLRSIVALLNGRGGVLIVGAVEKAHFASVRHHADLFRTIEEIGDFLVVGLAPDYGDRGNWDAWERRLRDVANTRIQPPAGSWYTAHRDTSLGRDIAVIVVAPPQDQSPYYLQMAGDYAFFTREGNLTRRLHGPEIHAYLDQRRRRR